MRRQREKLTVAGAFDSLRDGICLRLGVSPKVVVVASARRGEGRSTIAAGLARSLARLCEQPVVLVDFDLRRPALHTAFDAPVAPGVSDVLRDEVEFAAALQSVEGGEVLLLAAGAASQEATALLSSPSFSALLAELRARSVVVIDAPPLESGAEAEILASAANAVILVVCADQTTEQEAQAAAARLSAAGGAPLLGVVLNQARRGGLFLGGTPAAPVAWPGAEPTETRG